MEQKDKETLEEIQLRILTQWFPQQDWSIHFNENDIFYLELRVTETICRVIKF